MPRGDYAFEYLSTRIDNIDFIFTTDIREAMELLKNNKVDAVVGDEPVISHYLVSLDMKNDYKILDNYLYELDNVLAIPKSEKMLLSIINKGIFNLKEEQVMTKIQQKWFGISTPFIKEDSTEKIVYITTLLGTFLLLSFYVSYRWNTTLKKEVDSRTKELERRTNELLISKNDLQITFDSLKHLMLVIDGKGNILDVNKSLEKHIDIKKDTLVGKCYKSFGVLEFINREHSIVEMTLDNNHGYQIEIKDGQHIWDISTFAITSKNQQLIKVIIMIKDVTKLRLSEQRLYHESKMSAVGQLASGIAHEIRNPLGLIRSYAYIIKDDLSDQKEIEEATNIIYSSVEKASKIIDNLLNFSRISSDKYISTSIYDFLNNILELEAKVFHKNNILYEIDCDKQLVCSINQEAMKHILINIILNAVDSIENGGAISIEVKESNGYLVIICRDSGIGISKEDIDKIFNPFFTTKPVGKGTGLGLYIVYSEVKKLDGDIRVSSEVGKGTEFKIKIPLIKGALVDE